MKKPESFNKESSQITKGIAILWLLFYHLFSVEKDVMAMGVDFSPLGQNAFFTIASFGKICVAIFVIISSYGISKEIFTQSIIATDVYKKAFHRFFALLANFLFFFVTLCLVFSPWLKLTNVYGAFPQGLAYLFTDGLGLADLFGTATLNETWWYMSFAYELIFLVPVAAWATKKIGYGIIPVTFLLPLIFSMNYTNTIYLFSMGLGVAASYGDWFTRLLSIKLPGWLQWIIGVAGTAVAVILRYNPVIHENFEFVTDAMIAVFIIWTAERLWASIPIIRECLAFVGKNSLNIFLVHSFFYLIIFRDFIYGFKYAAVVYLMLIICSLGYSVILEAVKKFLVNGYKKIYGKKAKVNE